jgi:hypothetical protein
MYERFKELNIRLSEKTVALPTDLLDISGICRGYLRAYELLYSNDVNSNKRLLIEAFKKINNELYIHLPFHLKSLKKALNIIIKDLEDNFGKDILSKAIKIKDVFDASIIGQVDYKLEADLKICLFHSGDKLIGHDQIVIFFRGKDWQDNLLIKFDSNPINVMPVPRTLLRLHPNELKTILIELVRKYRMAFIKFWNTPVMTIKELKELICRIDLEGEDSLRL